MHQSTTPSLSQTIWPRWASRQFLSLRIVQTLLPVTFAYSLSSEAVIMRQLRRWKRLWGRSLTRSHKRTSIYLFSVPPPDKYSTRPFLKWVRMLGRSPHASSKIQKYNRPHRHPQKGAPQRPGNKQQTIGEVFPSQEDFHGAFQKLLERYNKWIAAGGDYFEGD